MRFTLSSILVAGAGIFLAAANAAGGPKPTDYPFILRAWHDPRDVQYPHIDRNVELDSGGRAVINKTENYPGFSSVSHARILILLLLLLLSLHMMSVFVP